MGAVQIPIELLLWALGSAVQLLVIYGAFRSWQSGVEARLKTVEGHSPKVDKINTIEADIESMKNQFSVEFKNLREDIRELARSVQQLALQRSA